MSNRSGWQLSYDPYLLQQIRNTTPIILTLILGLVLSSLMSSAVAASDPDFSITHWSDIQVPQSWTGGNALFLTGINGFHNRVGLSGVFSPAGPKVSYSPDGFTTVYAN